MKTFLLPDLGEGLAEAEIREWYVKVGDLVKLDQPLLSMETAKAVVDVPAPYTGKIVELHGKENEVIKMGAPLITFDTGGVTGVKQKGSVVGSLEESTTPWNEEEVILGVVKTKSSNVKALPAARVLAKELHVDLSEVTPSGPQGLITPEDVKRHISHSASSFSLGEGAETLHGVRRAMAHAMAQSHQEIVPVTIIEDVDITDLQKEMDITVHLLKAMAVALSKEPTLNAWFDGKKLERKLFDEVHIGLAMDTKEGLFVPVIKNVEKKSKEDLRKTIDTFKSTVADRSISPKEMQGATITLSNFGTIAGRYATPIIVPPTVAILGCGRSRETVMPRHGQIVIGRLMPLSLTFDHRAVTGGEATRFLNVVIQQLQGN